ncbi:MAG: hypothetical protein KC443_16305, partial [Anaerolineales bacterium]|nr:hypothetical protein [Anaerolineales bacterium]
MLLRHSLGLEAEAAAVETAVARTIAAGQRTIDLARDGEPSLSTQQMAQKIIAYMA